MVVRITHVITTRLWYSSNRKLQEMTAMHADSVQRSHCSVTTESSRLRQQRKSSQVGTAAQHGPTQSCKSYTATQAYVHGQEGFDQPCLVHSCWRLDDTETSAWGYRKSRYVRLFLDRQRLEHIRRTDRWSWPQHEPAFLQTGFSQIYHSLHRASESTGLAVHAPAPQNPAVARDIRLVKNMACSAIVSTRARPPLLSA